MPMIIERLKEQWLGGSLDAINRWFRNDITGKINGWNDPFSHIPSPLKERSQWVVYRLEKRKGKLTKVPYNPAHPAIHAKVNDFLTWGTYGEAVRVMQTTDVNGIGFVFAEEDPFCGVDLDHCRNPDTGETEEWALQNIRDLDSYTEISPSGTGFHIFVRGKLPSEGRKKGNIELYDQEKYFCMTGNHYQGTPREIQDREWELHCLHLMTFGPPTQLQSSSLSLPPPGSRPNDLEDEVLIEKAKQAKNGALFADLWEGKCEKYQSRSEADLALCNLLTFWTGGEFERIDRLFRQSGLYRKKWDEKHYSDGRTYGQGTIQQALKGSKEFYQPNGFPAQAQTADIPFPLEALPPILREYTQKLAEALPVSIDFVAVCVLVVAAAAIGSSRRIEVRPDWRMYPVLYAAIVGEPGTLKSPTLKAVLKPIRQYQRKLKDDWMAAWFFYEIEKQDYETQKKKSKAPPPKEPIMKRIIVGDTTVEKLGRLFNENREGLLLACDELSGWVKGHNQYKGGKGADRSFFLSLWDSSEIIIDRVTSPPIMVENPVMSIVGCIPPRILPELQDKHTEEDGFIHRLLFSYPPHVPPYWSETPVPEEVQNNYENLVAKILELREGGQSEILKLTSPAVEVFKAWHDAHVEEFSAPTFPPELKGYHAKLKGYCPRIALSLAVGANPQTTVVDKDSVEAACKITEYFKGQLLKIVPNTKRNTSTKEERCEHAILKRLKGVKELSRRDLSREVGCSAVIFNPVLDALVAAGRIIESDPPKPKRSKLYRLAKEEE